MNALALLSLPSIASVLIIGCIQLHNDLWKDGGK